MRSFSWARPNSLEDAAAARPDTVANAMVAHAGARLASVDILRAGGLDLLDLVKEDLLAPARLVDLRKIPGLDIIAGSDADGLSIGALTTLAAIESHPFIISRYRMLAQAASGVGSPQIRNISTLGGNLLQRPRCWYFRSKYHHCLKKGGGHCFAIPGENQYHAIFENRVCAITHPSSVATALVALGAMVELWSAGGFRRRIMLEHFFIAPEQDPYRENDLKPHEILTAVCLPALPASMRMSYLKLGDRNSFDWPLADVGVLLDSNPDERCRSAVIVLGAAGPVPHRASAAEQVLIGRCIDEKGARDAGDAAMQGATPLAKNAYKMPLFKALVSRAILTAAETGQGTPLI